MCFFCTIPQKYTKARWYTQRYELFSLGQRARIVVGVFFVLIAEAAFGCLALSGGRKTHTHTNI